MHRIVSIDDASHRTFDIGIVDGSELIQKYCPGSFETVVFGDDTLVGRLIHDDFSDPGNLCFQFAGIVHQLDGRAAAVDVPVELVGHVVERVLNNRELLQQSPSVQSRFDVKESSDFLVKTIQSIDPLFRNAAQTGRLSHAVRQQSPVRIDLLEVCQDRL